jgi:hypothetical protein
MTLIIHKSQDMTLPKVRIDIDNGEHQGSTFNVISRVMSLKGLHISSSFTFKKYTKMKEKNPCQM